MAANATTPVFSPQPNFNAAATALNAYATEIQRCSNLPAIQQGNDILQYLQRMETKMEKMETNIRDLRTRMETRMEIMEISIRDLRNDLDRGFTRQQTL